MTGVILRDRKKEDTQGRRRRLRLEGCSHKPRNARSHQKLEEAGRILPQSF